MWLFDTASLRSQDEFKNTDLWSVLYVQCIFRKISYVPTTEGTSVYDALEKGLDDLISLCDVVEMKFTLARDDFAAQMNT